MAVSTARSALATPPGARIGEAAKLLKVSKRQIYRWKAAGWTVHRPDGGIDVEATAARVEALRDSRGSGHPLVSGPDRESSPAGQPQTPGEAQDAADRADDLPAEVQSITLAEAKRRREYWLSERARLEVARRSGELVELAAAESVYLGVTVNLRTALDALPARLAPRLVGITSQAAIRALLREEIEDVLRSLPDAAPLVE